MSDVEARAEADEDEVSLAREVSVSHYPGCEPVTVRTTRLSGEESSRDERIRAGLRRMVQEGRIALPR
jgi:hypothetical protein